MTPLRQQRRYRVLGTGCALPGVAITTPRLLARLADNFGLDTRRGAALARRLGIETRHLSRAFATRLESPQQGARNPDLAVAALRVALGEAGCQPSDMQYLIGHTATPARPLPPNITEVAAQLDFVGRCAELRQACTGFANALQWARALLNEPDARPVALVGSEVGSVFFDPLALPDAADQWVNLVQMGDGAGAIVLGADDGRAGAWLEAPFYGHLAGQYSAGFAMLNGGSDYPALQAGRSCLDFSHDYHAVKTRGGALFAAGLDAVQAAGYALNEFRLILPHQVNGRIGALLGAAFGIEPERFYVNAHQVGNLGSAAIWVALHQLRHSGRLRPGDQVLILGAEATQYMYGGFVYVHGPDA